MPICAEPRFFQPPADSNETSRLLRGVFTALFDARKHRALVFSTRRKRRVLGWVAEWSIAHAWKACLPQGNGGSNPPPSAPLVMRGYDESGWKFAKVPKHILNSPALFADVWRGQIDGSSTKQLTGRFRASRFPAILGASHSRGKKELQRFLPGRYGMSLEPGGMSAGT